MYYWNVELRRPPKGITVISTDVGDGGTRRAQRARGVVVVGSDRNRKLYGTGPPVPRTLSTRIRHGLLTARTALDRYRETRVPGNTFGYPKTQVDKNKYK